MFVSIHADAVRDRDVSGASVYILSERGASSVPPRCSRRRRTPRTQGGISWPGRPDVRSVLLDLTQSAAIGGVEAPDRVLTASISGSRAQARGQQAAFVVPISRHSSMLVETAYISNPAEERKTAHAV